MSWDGEVAMRRVAARAKEHLVGVRADYARPAPAGRWMRAAGPALVAFAVLFNLYFLFPEVRDRPPDLNDFVFHSLNIGHAAQALDARADPTDPWVGEISMGFPIFHYYQHLPYVVPAAFHEVSGLGLLTTFHWTAYLLLCFFPLSMYWSMRRLGFGELEGGMAGLAAGLLATEGLFGFDLNSYVWIGWGLYTQLWGMVLLPPAIAQGYVTIRDGRGYFLAVFLLTATALSHLAFGYIAIGSLALVVLLRADRREIWARARRAFVLFAAFGLVASYFLVPLLLDSGYLNKSVWDASYKYDSFGAGWVLGRLFGGDLFDFGRFPSLSLIAGLGLVACLLAWRAERFRVPAVVGVLWLLLYFGRPTWGSLFDVTPLGGDLYLHRLIAGVHLGGLFLIGIGLAVPWRWALARNHRGALAVTTLVTVALLYPVYSERIDYLERNRDFMHSTASTVTAAGSDLDGLLTALEELPPGRVYAGLSAQWGGDYRTGSIPMYALLTGSGVDTLGRLYHPWSLNGDVHVLFDETRPEQYNLFNVRYVVAPRERTFPDFVRPIGEFGRHRLYEVETTGYFDVVGSSVAFTADKSSFYPVASAWLRSEHPAAGDHPVLVFPGQDRPPGLSVLPEDIAAGYLATASTPTRPTRGAVTSETVGRGEYQATVEVEQESTVLLKVTFHPGWRAYVDGQRVKPSMVMPSFMGVPVGPGTHDIRFEYHAPGYRLPLLVLGLLVLPLIWVAERRRPDLATFAERLGTVGPVVAGRRGWARGVARLSSALSPVVDVGRRRWSASGRLRRAGWRSAADNRDGASVDGRWRRLGSGAALLGAAWQVVANTSVARGLAVVLLAGLAVRLLLLPLYAYLPGEALDSYAWKRWMEAIDQHGVLNVFRVTRTDYVGYHWVLWALASVYDWFGGAYVEYPPRPGQYAAFPFGLHALMKAPGIVFDLLLVGAVYGATAVLAGARTSRRAVRGVALAAAAVVAFHPAVLYDSAVWAQIDAIGAAAMVAALVLVSKRRTGAGWALWTLGFLVKPHALVILPILLLLTLDRWEWRRLGTAAAASLGTAAIVLGPWVLHGDLGRIVDIYRFNLQGGFYTTSLSSGAWNLWWFSHVASGPVPGDAVFGGLPFLTYRFVGMALSVTAAAVAAVYFFPRRNLERALIAGAYLAFAFYLLPTSSHERYLYPFLGLLLPVAILDRRWLYLYVPVSVTFFLNLFVVAPPIHDWSGRWHESPFSLFVAGCNVLMFAAFTGVLVRGARQAWLELDLSAPPGGRVPWLAARLPRTQWPARARPPAVSTGRTSREPAASLAAGWLASARVRASNAWAGVADWWGAPSAGDARDHDPQGHAGSVGVAPRAARLKRELPWLGGVLVAGLLAGLPLLRLDWMMGHDSLAYLPRHVEFYEGLKAGAWFPRWAPDLGAGYGEPTFNFNPPLLYYLVSAIHFLGFGFVAAENLAILLLLVLSGFGMYFLAREFFGRRGGLVSAVAYVFAPFVLSRLYVSHALADFAAFPFLPIAFWCVYRYSLGGSYPFLVGAAVASAGIILTSLSVTAMAFPALIAWVTWIAFARRDARAAARGVAALALAGALAAFFLVPAMTETKFVHIDRREGRLDFHDHFLYFRQLFHSPWGWGLSVRGAGDGMSFALGPLYLAGTAAAVILLRRMRTVSRPAALAAIAFLGLIAICVFMMTSPSLFIWERVGALHPLQFPWRFLQLVALATAFLLGAPFVLLSRRRRAANGLMALMIGGLLLSGLPHAKPQGYLDLDEADYSAANIAARGIPATAREFEPIWVEQFPPTPRAEHLTFPDGGGGVVTSDIRAFDQRFTVVVERPSLIRLNTFYFPGWKLYVDGARRSVAYDHLPEGLMEFYLEPGVHAVQLKFEDTAVRTWSTWLSAFTLVGLMVAPAALALSRRMRVNLVERERERARSAQPT